jgi:hypothetical protein
VPYFYTNQYEGGVCDAREFSTGAIPEQQFSTLIPYMVKPDWLLTINVGDAQDSFFE